MSYFEIFLIAVSLCFDTLAVSLVGGACLKDMRLRQRVRICFFFALFQGGLTFVGWLLGDSVSRYIGRFDHWVAFALLLWIGGKMIIDSFSGSESDRDINLLDTKSLIVASIATSIDAFAVGISFAMSGGFGLAKTVVSVLIIALVTAASAAVGLRGGRRLGAVIGSGCNLAGGLVLIAIGVKILLEHIL